MMTNLDTVLMHSTAPAPGTTIAGTEWCRVLLGLLARIDTHYGRILFTRLEMQHGQRIEPVTYWITIGDTFYHTAFDKWWLEVESRLKGFIPDGLVFRVSSIDPNVAHAFATQTAYISAFVNVLNAPARQCIAGIAAHETTP